MLGDVIFWLFLIAIFIYNLKDLIQRKLLAREEFRESLHEGAVEEPHAFRELTIEEREVLGYLQKEAATFVNSFWKNAGMGFLVFVFVGAWSYSFLGDNSGWFNSIPLVLQFGFLALIGLNGAVLVLWFYHKQESQYYKDLNVPVWQVQGALVMLGEQGKARKEKVFMVRNQRFTLEIGADHDAESFHQHQMLQKLQQVKIGSETLVEYSPFSHYIWDIRATKDRF